MATFYENLKALRIKAGLTQADLAKKLEISRSLISHYEKGKRLPSYKTLKDIRDLFDVSYDDLLADDDFNDYYKSKSSFSMSEEEKNYKV